MAEKKYRANIGLPKFQWSIAVKKTMVRVSIPTAKYLTAKSEEKNSDGEKSNHRNLTEKKVSGTNIQLKIYMANCLAAGTYRLECFKAVSLIIKSLSKRRTLK